MPMILLEVLVGFKSIASFIDRIDSAKRDNGIEEAAQYISEDLEIVLGPNSLSFLAPPRPGCDFFCSGWLSSGTSDMQGSCSAASSCAEVRKTRSIISRRNPSPAPNAIPPNIAIASIRLVLGLLLLCGGEAGEITLVSDIGNVSCCAAPM